MDGLARVMVEGTGMLFLNQPLELQGFGVIPAEDKTWDVTSGAAVFASRISSATSAGV